MEGAQFNDCGLKCRAHGMEENRDRHRHSGSVFLCGHSTDSFRFVRWWWYIIASLTEVRSARGIVENMSLAPGWTAYRAPDGKVSRSFQIFRQRAVPKTRNCIVLLVPFECFFLKNISLAYTCETIFVCSHESSTTPRQQLTR